MSRESGGSQRMRSTSMTEREARLLRRERIKMRNRDLIQRERNEMKRSYEPRSDLVDVFENIH